ncbi:hypothetical protein ACIBP6_12935 [Nonomuraea terrae]|uniref:hypothetical protein n=1 Tax=Nonomuraea terrae TaxID=2530383 RepID=UPI0037961D42
MTCRASRWRAVQSFTCAVAVLCLVALLIRTRVRAQGETMNTTALRTAYDGLLAVAEAIGATPLTADVRSAVDWTLSHVALSDRLLAAAARDVLSGRPVTVDNRDAMDEAAIASLTGSTTHAERVDLVRRHAAGLRALVEAMPDEAAATPVRIRLVGRDGRAHPDQRITWSELIRLRAEEHVPGHAARLRALAAGGVGQERSGS